MIELTGAEALDGAYVGGKARHLNQLIALGLNVPPTIVIPVEETPDAAQIAAWCRRVLGVNAETQNGVWRYAAPPSSRTRGANRRPGIT